MKQKKLNDTIKILSNFISTSDSGKYNQTFEERKDTSEIEADLKRVQSEMQVTKEEFKEVKQNLKSQNIKLVEFLGIFTAILAFITLTGNIAIKNLNPLDFLLFIPALALALLIFVIGIDVLINKEKRGWFWFGFWFLTIVYVTAVLIIKFDWFGL